MYWWQTINGIPQSGHKATRARDHHEPGAIHSGHEKTGGSSHPRSMGAWIAVHVSAGAVRRDSLAMDFEGTKAWKSERLATPRG